MELLAKKFIGILLAPLFIAAQWVGYLPNQDLDITPVIKDQVQQAVEEQNLGAFSVTGGGTYRIRSSIGTTNTTINLVSFKEPVSNTPYTMAYINSSVVYGTLSPQTTRSEFISFTGITQNADGTAQLTGVSRGLSRTPQGNGCTESATFAQKHGGQSVFILSDSPCLFAEYAVKNNDETITGSWTVPTPTASGNPTNKSYVDALVNGGTVSTDSVIVAATAGTTITSGQLVYFNRYEAEWGLADADTSSTTNGVMLGVAQGAGSDGSGINGGVLLKGLDTTNTGGTNGQVIYISGTAGATSTSAGTVERAVGIIKSNTSFYFDPVFSVPNLKISNGKIEDNLISTTTLGLDSFGGNGADGALSCSSGTTYVDLESATTTVKEYSSISITGTCAIGFINAATNGTATTGAAIIFKSQGDVTITSSATRAIDVRSLGGYAGSGGGMSATGTIAFKGDSFFSIPWHGMPGGPGLLSKSGQPADGATTTSFSSSKSTAGGFFKYVWGAGGGGGGGGCANGGSGGGGGAGGHGGGAFRIQSGGALNFTGTIDASGIAGTAGSVSSGNGSGGGGGGGGGAGSIEIIYRILTANTGTLNVAGGVGGTGGGNSSPGSCYGGNGGSGGSSATSTNATTKSSNATATVGSDGSNGVSLIGKIVNW